LLGYTLYPEAYFTILSGLFTGCGIPMVNVSKEGQVFECEICGNIVVVKFVGGGELVCCGQKMKLHKE
jgi:desulfoferrodoxin-like iron-binding protein